MVPLGQGDRERRRRADRYDQRDTGDDRLLDDLEAEPAGNREDRLRQRQPAGAERPAGQLVDCVVAADVLARGEQRPPAVEEGGAVQAAGRREQGLGRAQPLGQRREQGSGNRPGRGDRRGADDEVLDRALAADAAARRGEEAPLAHAPGARGVERDLQPVVAVVERLARALEPADLPRRSDDALREEESGDQLLVVARGAHEHGERLAAEADLERRLDRQAVGLQARLARAQAAHRYLREAGPEPAAGGVGRRVAVHRGHASLAAMTRTGRLTQPLVRDGRRGNLRPATWDEALDRAAAGLAARVERQGPGAFGIFSCSKARTR